MNIKNNLDTTLHPELIHPTAFVAQGAIIVGQVTLEAESSVWFNSTLRGDTTPVIIGAGSNVQEGCILHADPGFPCVLGAGVTAGHGAVIHGATIGDNALVGIRSTVLNGVVVGENSIVGAGTLLPPGKQYPAGVLILGSPGKVIRELTAEEIVANQRTAQSYRERAVAFRAAGWAQLFPEMR